MSWLSNRQLVNKIHRNADEATRHAFGGVYSISQLPSAVHHYPYLMIVNTQSHNLPGEHWLSIFISKDRMGEVFDSFALPLSNMLIRWLNRFTKRWRVNHLTVQHPLSATCGSFALYYVLNRLKKEMTFSKTFHKNESRVHVFYQTLK